MAIELNQKDLKFVLKKVQEIKGIRKLTMRVDRSPYLAHKNVSGPVKLDFEMRSDKIASWNNNEMLLQPWNLDGDYKGLYYPTEESSVIIKEISEKVRDSEKEYFNKILNNSTTVNLVSGKVEINENSSSSKEEEGGLDHKDINNALEGDMVTFVAIVESIKDNKIKFYEFDNEFDINQINEAVDSIEVSEENKEKKLLLEKTMKVVKYAKEIGLEDFSHLRELLEGKEDENGKP